MPKEDKFKSEFTKIQLTELIGTYRAQLTILSQITTTFVLAGATIFGLGITSQRAALFIVTAMLPLTLILLRWRAFSQTLPIMYMGIYLESKYGQKDMDYMISTYTSTVDGEKVVKRLKEIAAIEDQPSRARQLREIARQRRLSAGDLLLVLVSLLLIAFALVVHSMYGWPLGLQFVQPKP